MLLAVFKMNSRNARTVLSGLGPNLPRLKNDSGSSSAPRLFPELKKAKVGSKKTSMWLERDYHSMPFLTGKHAILKGPL